MQLCIFWTLALTWRSCMSITDLYILTLIPFEGQWAGGRSLLINAGMAIDQINKRNDILPGYRLNMIWNDTKCNAGIGVNAMYSQLYSPPTKIIMMGAACSPVTEATSSAAYLWNIVTISAVSASSSLSNKKRFPNFFRIQTPEVDTNPGRIDIFKQFGWSNIATIHSPKELFSVSTENLQLLIGKANMSVLRSAIISNHLAVQIKDLKDHDVRVIVGSFYEPVARQVFCEAYKVGLYGPKIVWVINGWYDENWWNVKKDTDCTIEEMSEAVEGYFTVDRIYMNPKPVITVSGLTSQQYYAIYQNLTNYTELSGAKMSPMAYDTAWAIALALNNTMNKLAENGSSKRLENFTYDDVEMGKMIRQSMQDLKFVGVKGHLYFNKNGDPVGMFSINRRQGGKLRMVGLYNPDMASDIKIEWFDHEPVIWQDGKIPKDSVTIYETTKRLSFYLYIAICAISGLGICITFVFLIFNVRYRHTRIVKMSSPKLNNITLVGCLLLYCAVFLEDVSETDLVLFCKAKVLLIAIGFSLVFGALFAKTWRVHVIFTNPTKQRIIVKDGQLFLMVAALAVVNILVIVIWNAIDPMEVVIVNLQLESDTNQDIQIRSKLETCESPNQIYYMATLFVIQGILMFLGTFLAWETRNVTAEGLNDSKMIGMCIYNVVVLSFLAVCISMTVKNDIDLKYALTSVIIIIATTVTQCLIIVPKMLTFRGNKVDAADQTTVITHMNTTTTCTHVTGAAQQLAQCKERIKELEEQLSRTTMTLQVPPK